MKTPTLGIICLRELEIRNFKPEDYFEIVATANVVTPNNALGRRSIAERSMRVDGATIPATASTLHQSASLVAVTEQQYGPLQPVRLSWWEMKGFKEKSFAERRETAAKAKQAKSENIHAEVVGAERQ